MQSTYMRARRNKKRRSFEFRWSFHDNHGGSPCIHPSPLPLRHLLSFLMLLPLPLPFLQDYLSRSRWRVRALTSMWNAPYVTTSRKKIRQEGNARHEFLGRLPVRFTMIFRHSDTIVVNGHSLLHLNRIKCNRWFWTFWCSSLNKRSLSEKERMAIEIG